MIRTLAIGLAAALIGVTAPAAQADGRRIDHRPCVSKREFYAADHPQRRDLLEERWEVAGLGRRIEDPTFGSLTIYPRCAYSPNEAWYGVQYKTRHDGHLWTITQIWWIAADAKPHGNP